MVLDNVSFEDVPQSDGDPYDPVDSTGARRYDVDTSTYPRPFRLPFMHKEMSDEALGKQAGALLATRSQQANRPLTHEEAEAFVYYHYKGATILSYSTPLGVVGGGYRCWDTRKTYRFPFWQPNLEKFTPDVYGSILPRPFRLEGRAANVAWQAFPFFPFISGSIRAESSWSSLWGHRCLLSLETCL